MPANTEHNFSLSPVHGIGFLPAHGVVCSTTTRNHAMQLTMRVDPEGDGFHATITTQLDDANTGDTTREHMLAVIRANLLGAGFVDEGNAHANGLPIFGAHGTNLGELDKWIRAAHEIGKPEGVFLRQIEA